MTDSSFQYMHSQLASCGLFVLFFDWEEDTEPSSQTPMHDGPPTGSAPSGQSSPCQSAPVCVPQHWEDSWSLEANSAPGPMGTACQAPLQLRQRDHKDKGASRLNHDHVALPAKVFQVISSLLASMPNTNPPKGYSQKPECLLLSVHALKCETETNT